MFTVALGNNAYTTGFNSIAIGRDTRALGTDSIAMGVNAEAEGINIVTIGSDTKATNNSVSIGSGAKATNNSVSIGAYAQVSSFGVAIGENSNANSNSVVVGGLSNANGISSIAVGLFSYAIGNRAIALGEDTNANGNDTIAIGGGTRALNNYSISIGRNAIANGINNVVIGVGAKAINNATIAIGLYTNAIGISAIAIGLFSRAASNRAIALGENSDAEGSNSIAIGIGSHITGGDYGIAIGTQTEVTTAAITGGVAIGRRARCIHASAVILSPNNGNTSRNTNANNRILFGYSGITPAGFAAFSNVSDKRDKLDITPLRYNALEFINSLDPVQYRMDFRSDYIKYKEITDEEYDSLDEYGKRHEVYKEKVWFYENIDSEWIDNDVYFSGKGKYATEFLKKYEKNDRKAIAAFKKTKTYKDMPKNEEEEIFINTTKKSRITRFLRVQLKPDGTRAGKRYHNGFIAQQVEEAANRMGFDCPAVEFLAHNKDEYGVPMGDDLYSMKYTELLAPMVAAIQQLTAKNAELEARLAKLEAAII